MINSNDECKKYEKSRNRKRIVVVKRDEEEGAQLHAGGKGENIRAQHGKQNLAPLAVSGQKEPAMPVAAAEKEAGSGKKAEVILPQSAIISAASAGPMEAEEKTKESLIKGECSQNGNKSIDNEKGSNQKPSVGDKSAQKKEAVEMAEKKDDSDKKLNIQTEEKNLAPLAGPAQEEPVKPTIIESKGGTSGKKTEVVLPQSATNLAPLGGPMAAEEEAKKVVIKEASKEKEPSNQKEGSEDISTHKKRDKEMASDAKDKTGVDKKPEDRMAYPGSSNPKACAKCNKDTKACRCAENGGMVNKENKCAKCNESSCKCSTGSRPIHTSNNRVMSSTLSDSMSLHSSGSKPAAPIPTKSEPQSRTSTPVRSEKPNPQVKIDENRNRSHKIGDGSGTGFVPCKLESPDSESILHELRRKNSVIAEGFIYKKRAFFFCFWVKKYFVLLKTGELMWLEEDGSGTGYGNWNIKRSTAFNKLDYDGYSHPHRFTYSVESSTGYLAFDTEAERNYWFDMLQDASRS